MFLKVIGVTLLTITAVGVATAFAVSVVIEAAAEGVKSFRK